MENYQIIKITLETGKIIEMYEETEQEAKALIKAIGTKIQEEGLMYLHNPFTKTHYVINSKLFVLIEYTPTETKKETFFE